MYNVADDSTVRIYYLHLEIDSLTVIRLFTMVSTQYVSKMNQLRFDGFHQVQVWNQCEKMKEFVFINTHFNKHLR